MTISTGIIGAIDAVLASGRVCPAFPAELEQRYERDRAGRRTRRMRSSLLETAVIYNGFLVADWLLTRDMLTLAFVLHFFVVTPILLLAVALQDIRIRPAFRDGIVAIGALAIGAQILAVFWFSSAPGAVHYQYLMLVLLVFTNTSQRLPFRFAAPVSAVLTIFYLATVYFSHALSVEQLLFVLGMTLGILYQTVLSTYELERAIRRSYLLRLRTSLVSAQHEAAAQSDPLTGLSNRRHLDLTLERLFQPGRQRPVAAILLDLDHFKAYNDHYGHVAGDAALRRVAACLSTALRRPDELAVRYGGEELMLLLPDTDAAAAHVIAERLRQGIEALAIPHEAQGAGRLVTASFGVAAADENGTAAALIAAADEALYAAKRAGRNCVWPPVDADGATGKVLPLVPRLIRQGTGN